MGEAFGLTTLGYISLDNMEDGVWKKFEIGIGSHASNFNISFKREKAATYDAGVALNDLQFTDCALPDAQDNCGSEV